MRRFSIIIIFFSLVCIGFNVHVSEAARPKQKKAKRIYVKPVSHDPRTRWKNLDYALKREAKRFNGQVYFVIKDMQSGREIDYNDNIPVPAASVIKIPIMAALLDAADKKKINLNSVIVLQECYKSPGSGTLKCMPGGTKYSIRKLIELMITESDNTATNLLIRFVGFEYLNGYFKKIGLKKTYLGRYMMDMTSRKKGIENYTSAHDLALILEKMYRGTLTSKKVSYECLYFLKRQKLHDRIPKKLPSYVVTAHKTGLEKGICHDAGIVFTNNGDFIIVALTKHRNKLATLAKKLIAQMAWLTYNTYQFK